MRLDASSLMTLKMLLLTIFKGGKAYDFSSLQVKLNVSTAKLNGSGYQEACLCKCLFRWDVIKSVLDEKENLYFILLNKLGESYHSLLSLNFLAWNRLWSCHIQECVQLRSGLVYVCTISKWS